MMWLSSKKICRFCLYLYEIMKMWTIVWLGRISPLTTLLPWTLYTMLPHSLTQIFLIIDSMNDVIDLAFKKFKDKFILLYENSSGNWSNKPGANTLQFDAESLKFVLLGCEMCVINKVWVFLVPDYFLIS